MRIEVAGKTGDSTTVIGKLLENLAEKLLVIQDYKVEKQTRFSGVEIDLLCRHGGTNKQIYVECKAYDELNHINSQVITSMVGIKNLKEYDEAWLISTSELGKEAKGLVANIQADPDKSKGYSFYTPKRLIEALSKTAILIDVGAASKIFLDCCGDENLLGEKITLFITPYGNFWVKEYLSGGNPKGLICLHANNGNIVKDEEMLKNLSKLDSSFKKLDFQVVTKLTNTSGKLENPYQNISINDFKLRPSYVERINDIGIRLTHPHKDDLFLEDLYVFPDLENINEEASKLVSSKELQYLKDDYRKCLIFGEDISGKTSLALSLQKNILVKDLVIIYLHADEIKSFNIKDLDKNLIRCFKSQYSEDKFFIESFNKILSTDKSKILLIIDDIDMLGIKSDIQKTKFLENLDNSFSKLILFANKNSEIEFMTDHGRKKIFENYKIFRLKEFGHVLRDNLIEKWLTIGNTEAISDEEFLHRKDQIAEKIKIAVGTNFVPTYPLYLLTMLQLIEAGNNSKLQGSSYAELYRYLINDALGGANTKPEDLDFFHTYLSALSYDMFKNQKREFSESEIKNFHVSYSLKMDLDKTFRETHGLLVKAKILKIESGLYQFNHNYTYYFFIAKYIADHVKKNEIKKVIEKITRKLHTNESANIIIFLIHHSKNQEIIDKVMMEAEQLFTNVVPYTLSDNETSKINSLMQEEVRLSMKDEKTSEYRKKKLVEKDEHARKARETEEVDDRSKLDIFGQINLSFKLIEILGQISKSYYGSIDAKKKAKILKTIYLLSFRALRVFLEDFEKFQKTIREQINESIKSKKNIEQKDIDKIVDKLIFGFTGGLIMLFINKISDSVASKNLFKSIDKMLVNEKTPASTIVGVAVKLNFPDGLSKEKISKIDDQFKKNNLIKILLRVLVIEHLYKFKSNYADRQSICDTLGIGFNERRLMFEKGRKKF